jgi:hypothetical protein
VKSSVNPDHFKFFNVKSKKERIRRYRRYVYEVGSLNQPEKGNVKVIEDKVLKKERNRRFELSETDRFRYRTRYFTDSGIIGSKEFVAQNYQRFKHLFHSKHEKKPRSIKGLEGMYSLKRLSEAFKKYCLNDNVGILFKWQISDPFHPKLN